MTHEWLSVHCVPGTFPLRFGDEIRDEFHRGE